MSQFWSGTPAKQYDSWSEVRSNALRAVPHGGHIHIIGICGTGTGAVLQLLVALGYRVTGSDKSFYPPMGDIVRGLAAEVFEGYAAENLNPAPDCVIIGNTAALTNPEVQAVFSSGLPFCSMPEALSALLIGDRSFCPTSIVVAGTHGKTTTTALITWILECANRKPAYFVGGVVQGLAQTIRPQDATTPVNERVVILEGDEYDSACFAKYSKFHAYRPDVLVLTSLEFDHGDIFDSIEAIEAQFTELAPRIPEAGAIFVADTYSRAVEMIRQWGRNGLTAATLCTYGKSAQSNCRLISRESLDESQDTLVQRLVLEVDGKELVLSTPLSGEHNAYNILAAAAVAYRVGVSFVEIQKAVSSFKGVRRRQQEIFNAEGVIVVEDFAHHPTAVATTLRGLREKYAPKRLIAVFDPRSNTSRRHFFQDTFVTAFLEADIALIRECGEMPTYSATGEIVALDVAKLITDLKTRGVAAKSAENVAELCEELLAICQAGDVIVLMSNGSFDGLPSLLPSELNKRLRVTNKGT